MTLTTHLGRFHVQHFGDPTLHDEEVWVINVELHGSEQILHARVLSVTAIDQIFIPSTNNNLQKTDMK